jgi:hypothetical protein
VAWALPVLVVLTAATPAAPPRALAAAGVSPGTVTQLLPPNTFTTFSATVDTPRIPQRADIVLLVDGTASMRDVIAQVQADLTTILGPLPIGPDAARVGVVAYRDTTPGFDGDGLGAFQVLTRLSGVRQEIATGIGGLSAFGGSPDAAEDWINALVQVGNGDAGAFRPDATPIVVLVGDAPSHDPSFVVTDPDAEPDPENPGDPPSHTLADAIGALSTHHVQVLALGVRDAAGNVTSGGGLDSGGQAGPLAAGTGGPFQDGIKPGEIAATIAARLADRPTTANHQVLSCDPGLTVTLDPPDRTVTSGTQARFAETVTVAADAPQGGTLTCVVQFSLSALPSDGTGTPTPAELRQTISVQVQDVTRPEIVLDDQNLETTDPAGIIVNYTATAADVLDGPLAPACAPASGTLFPIGPTAIDCTATDLAGNVARKTAVVRVTKLEVPPEPRADVRVLSLLAKPRPGFVGGSMTVSAELTNLGPDPATGVVLDLALPAGSGRALGAQLGCSAAEPCTIAAGARRTVVLGVRYAAAVTGTVRATATGTLPDPVRANNTRTAPLSVLAPRLVVTPTVGRPGTVVQARGTGFPPGSTVVLTWLPGITAGHPPIRVAANGSFTSQVLILRKDQRGRRVLRASGTGFTAIEIAFLVTNNPVPLLPPPGTGLGR